MPQRDLQRRAQRAAWWSQAAASRLPLLRFLTRGPLLSGRSAQAPFAPPGGPDGAPSGALPSGPYPPRFVPPLPLSSGVEAPAAPEVETPGTRTAVSRRMAAIAAAEGSPGSSAYLVAPGRGDDPEGVAPRGGGVPQGVGAAWRGRIGTRDDSAGRRSAGPSVPLPAGRRGAGSASGSGRPAELRATAPAAAPPATPQAAAPLPAAPQAAAPVRVAPPPAVSPPVAPPPQSRHR